MAEVAREVLAVVDLGGVECQAVAATRLAAAPRGGGPVGILRSLLERGTGVSERRADPEGYLRRWRDRGSLERAAKPLRDLVTEAMPRLPASARAGFAPVAGSDDVISRLAGAIDRSIGGPEAPGMRGSRASMVRSRALGTAISNGSLTLAGSATRR